MTDCKFHPHLYLSHTACKTIDVSPVTCPKSTERWKRRRGRQCDKERHGLAGGEIMGMQKGREQIIMVGAALSDKIN